MKTLVSIFILFFSFEIYADVGDKYSCKTLEGAKIGANGIEKYEKEKVISRNIITRGFGFIFRKLSILLEHGNDYSGTDRNLGNL